VRQRQSIDQHSQIARAARGGLTGVEDAESGLGGEALQEAAAEALGHVVVARPTPPRCGARACSSLQRVCTLLRRADLPAPCQPKKRMLTGSGPTPTCRQGHNITGEEGARQLDATGASTVLSLNWAPVWAHTCSPGRPGGSAMHYEPL
jgi:hypothetical protein